jgi:DNA-binding CsgD family transcriptional regulator
LPAQVSELTAAANDGVRLSELARRYGVDRSTVVDHLNRPATVRRSPALSEAEVEEAVRRYEAGMSFREVGQVFGAHASKVRQYIARAGVKPRGRSGR